MGYRKFMKWMKRAYFHSVEFTFFVLLCIMKIEAGRGIEITLLNNYQ